MLASILSIVTVLSGGVMRVVPFAGFLFNPLWTAAKFVFNLAGNPLGRVVLIVALAVGAYMAGDVRGRLKEHDRCKAQIVQLQEQSKKEAADAVAKADAARQAAEQKFNSGRFNNRPGIVPRSVRHGSDGFSRD